MPAPDFLPAPLRGERSFRWRGGELSRLEALADAVFALALTLLIVSLQAPRSYAELVSLFAHVPAFLAATAFLMMCWFFHYQFHRRYGLEDGPTIVLNAAFLFLILLYVYPLKFVFALLFEMFFGLGDMFEEARVAGTTVITFAQWSPLMIIYGLGFAAIFAVLLLMNLHAYRRRADLQLDAREVMATRLVIRSHAVSVAFGLVSSALAALGGSFAPFAGMLYMLIGPVQGTLGWLGGRQVERVVLPAPPESLEDQ